VLGKPLIAYLFERLSSARNLDEVILATSTDPSDEPLVDFARMGDIALFRGSKDDVLARYYHCARQMSAQTVVRITGDCPLIDPALVDEVVEFGEFSDAKVARNIIAKTLGFPRGMDVEYMRFEVLEYLHNHFTEQRYREHVTLAVYEEDIFGDRRDYALRNYPAPANADWDVNWRLCVDEPPDFEVVKMIIEGLYPANPHFTLSNIAEFLRKNPQIAKINAIVRQKEA